MRDGVYGGAVSRKVHSLRPGAQSEFRGTQQAENAMGVFRHTDRIYESASSYLCRKLRRG